MKNNDPCITCGDPAYYSEHCDERRHSNTVWDEKGVVVYLEFTEADAGCTRPLTHIVYMDLKSPYSGTQSPNGSRCAPVNNLEDAKAISDLYKGKKPVGIKKIHLNWKDDEKGEKI